VERAATKNNLSRLSVSLDDQPLFWADVPEVNARRVALLAWAVPSHTSQHPQHATALATILAAEVRTALRSTEFLEPWDHACLASAAGLSDIRVSVDLHAPDGPPSPNATSGAGGGAGGWPGGGGGGGGGGLSASGAGGSGQDGALIVFQWSDEPDLIDVQMFVTAGTDTWHKRPWAKLIRVIAIGGGGGGGSGGTGTIPT
jgi:hypothetical protein